MKLIQHIETDYDISITYNHKITCKIGDTVHLPIIDDYKNANTPNGQAIIVAINQSWSPKQSTVLYLKVYPMIT